MSDQIFTTGYPIKQISMVYDHNSSGYKSFDSKISIVDPESDLHVSVTPFGGLNTYEETKLIGGDMEAVFDTFRWTGVSGAGGGIEILDGLTQLTTHGSANATIRINSVKVGRFFSSMNNRFVAGVRLPQTGVGNNVRRWGAMDTNNGLYFFSSGSFNGIGVRKGGTETLISGLNGYTPLVVDANFHLYEITFSPGTARFFQDRKMVHHQVNTTGQICNTMSLKIGFENNNVNGGTSNTALQTRGAAILRCGKANSRPLYHHISTASTQILKIGAGTLHRIIVGVKGTANATVTLYDNTSGTGTVICILNMVDFIGAEEINIDFDTGLTVVAAGTVGDVTIIFD